MELALHIPNGIINIPTSAIFGVIALIAVGFSLYKARQDLDQRLVPMAGLACAFIFAAQMIMFPIAAGVAGHLLGGALALVLLGPWLAIVCVTVVLVIQGLMFADGGLTALGLNITNIAVLTALSAALVVAVGLKILPRTKVGVTVSVFLAGFVSVLVSVLGFLVQFAMGGEPLGQSFSALTGAMLGSHVLIGIGEGLISAFVVITVAATRPDLVWALKGRQLNTDDAKERTPQNA
ncbi:energy-coupling factor ABC transporter permease [Haloglycomyces albus]|uniref:energy-coupling factor ABC transporter permease n=1 Tax=Haloglycomyces albus TaxID=526067 RepID=UPI00046CC81B|nr:energy-coupling factor ABC transporter permease [Haloglycomyces albus]